MPLLIGGYVSCAANHMREKGVARKTQNSLLLNDRLHAMLCLESKETIYFIIFHCSIVKDSNADLEVISKIVQIRPTVKAVSIKISKKIFCIFVNILIFLRENNEASFFLF